LATHLAESQEGSSSDDVFDLLLFPHQLRLVGVTRAQISEVVALIDKVSVEHDETLQNLPPVFHDHSKFEKEVTVRSVEDLKRLSGLRLLPLDPKLRHFFVCSHMERDARCGCVGPVLAEEIVKMQHPQAKVMLTSHVGGHQFAGNIMYD